jgi:hypothetical protein
MTMAVDSGGRQAWRAAPAGGGAAIVAALLLAAPIAPAHAQTTPRADEGPPASTNPETMARPVARAGRANGPIRVDGRLDEPDWQQAPPFDRFIQSQPHAGAPATELTIVRILYDAERLYIGAECRDSEPRRLVVPSLEQDFESADSDIFGVTLDPFHDRRNAFMFLVNPRGAVKDAQDFDDSRLEDAAWEGVIQVKTRIHDQGWTVELALPFTTLRFDPRLADQVWGMNVLRRIRRKNEEAYWAPLDRRDRIHRMSKAGTLEGLEHMRAGHNLTIKPYVLATDATGGAFGRSNGAAADGGGDLKYGITPKLTLDATIRTDFSQVEVDQEQVNLTRFPLFFPEKRDFFLENSGAFAFGDISERGLRLGASLRDFTLFHSRRIGLTSSGQPIPILGGARLTGKVREFELGLLNMQTRSSPLAPAENFTAARLRRPLAQHGDVGLLVLNRQVTDGDTGFYNRSAGAEVNLRFVGNLVVNSYVAVTDQPGRHGPNTAERLTVGWRDRLWDISGFVKQVGDAFTPGMGFVRRTAMRQSYATLGLHPRPRIGFVQEVNPYVEVDYTTNLRSVLETRNTTLGLDVPLIDGGRVSVTYNDGFERLIDPFPVLSHTVIPPGDYRTANTAVSFSTSAGRALSGQASVTRGGYYDGDKTSVALTALWRPTSQLSVDGSIDRNRVALPAESFDANVFGVRVKYAFSTTLFASAFVQYNAAADQVVTNLRFNFIHAPLSDLFVVYTDRRHTTDATLLERSCTVKFTKLLAF